MTPAKYLLSNTLVLFISLIANAQIDPPESNHEKLKGHVKSVQEDTFEAVDSFGDYKKTTHYASFFGLVDEKNNVTQSNGFKNGKKRSYNAEYIAGKNFAEIRSKKVVEDNVRNRLESWIYDSRGNIIEHNRTINDTLEEKEIAVYNNKNQLTSYKSYGADGKLDWQKSFTYDLQGNKAEELIFNEAGYYHHEQFKYTVGNKLIASILFDQNEKMDAKKNYRYDKLGNMIEETSTQLNAEYSNYNYRKVMQFNQKGKITSEIKYDRNGNETDRRTFKYDSKNRLIFEETRSGKHLYNFDLSGNLMEQIDFYYNDKQEITSKSVDVFEYDSTGNWVKKIEYFVESPAIIPKTYTLTERIITYR